MDEAHQKLVKIVKIIEQNYGRDMISPNLHLSLHLYECAKDFGPLYTFWYFLFKCMNGMLGSLPNSHRKIEPKLMRQIMNDKQINNIVSSGIVNTKGLDILDTRPSVDYYNVTYPANNFQKPFREGPEDSIIIRIRMNQFRRCRIGSKIFSSKMSSRHVKSSFVTAKFITIDDDVDVYPDQVQYYFTHTVDLLNGPAKHFLVYVRWYKHAGSRNIQYYFSSDNDINTCAIVRRILSRVT
ncbi:hypothetical protein RhiirC2_801713 [Rhizophagus irregularis]|uniref:DUF4218 domain-containing protein n=1 Tax=Rhizophagus irregularis TaxID=588596 RepID=A0A2N1M213_9GLOM|nr:hypothetical protein RhiirC2_801713 [Rhizophagus irregularis]